MNSSMMQPLKDLILEEPYIGLLPLKNNLSQIITHLCYPGKEETEQNEHHNLGMQSIGVILVTYNFKTRQSTDFSFLIYYLPPH